MYELIELFDDMIKFEDDLSNVESSEAHLARAALKTYTENRFSQIQLQQDWVSEIKQ